MTKDTGGQAFPYEQQLLKQGGAAFPFEHRIGPDSYVSSCGLSVRDYFAAKALPAVLQTCAGDTINYMKD